MAKAPSNKMRLRMMFLMVIFTVGVSGVLIARLFHIQIVQGEDYQRKAVQQQMSSLPISAARGQIKDTNGKTLAVSATVWNVVADPSVVSTKPRKDGRYEADIIAKNLSEILGLDEASVREKCLKKDTRHVYIKKRIEKPEQEKIVQFLTKESINSVYLTEDTKRYYPYGSLGSTVIGFVNDENMGGAGLESEYNKILSGTPGMVVSAKTAMNTDMPFRYQHQMYEAKNGNTLILTIDETIQHFLEKHLENAVFEQAVKNRAVGIVMDVNTGAVLAMATKPDFDPNSFKEIYDQAAQDRLLDVALTSGGTDTEAYLKAKSREQNLQWRNKAVSDPYEPGSVFKVVTAAAALDHGDVSLNTYFDCFGSIEVADRNIGCWKTIGHGNQDFTEALKHSCNPAFVRIGQMLRGGPFYDYFEAFGLTQGTGIDLPGEAASIYHEKKTLESSLVSLASSSFGQSFKVTPIQMLTAVCASVNGGKLVTPYVVRQIVDDTGNVVQTMQPKIRRQVISEETSKTIASMMEKVVSDSDGSGKNAYIAGYRIGGKTGTSQKLDQGIKDGEEEHWLSFVGIAPSDNPQVACLVILDTPTAERNVQGSTVAAPVVKYVMADMLPYMGIEPKYTAEEQASRDLVTPNVINKDIAQAKSILEEQKLNIKVVGEGDVVMRQVPTPSTLIPREATVIAYTDEGAPPTMVQVPDVLGLGTSIVNQMLTNAGLNLRFTGGKGSASIASRQTPEPGTEVEIGTVVTIDLTATDVGDNTTAMG